jgi:hypothetical protein
MQQYASGMAAHNTVYHTFTKGTQSQHYLNQTRIMIMSRFDTNCVPVGYSNNGA